MPKVVDKLSGQPFKQPYDKAAIEWIWATYHDLVADSVPVEP